MRLKILSGCCLFLILTGCQGLSESWHGKPPPPVTAAEWNETEYKILVQQVAALNATEARNFRLSVAPTGRENALNLLPMANTDQHLLARP